ncbi:hypothetical protein GF342_03480 [Candidatus Woesearchaeota archaeon]|nr:hypothetical protein [Candidatus Woesearchaeota archaeon]
MKRAISIAGGILSITFMICWLAETTGFFLAHRTLHLGLFAVLSAVLLVFMKRPWNLYLFFANITVFSIGAQYAKDPLLLLLCCLPLIGLGATFSQQQLSTTHHHKVIFLLVVVLLVAGLSIRLTGLTSLEPYTDEYSHLVSAQALRQYEDTRVTLDGELSERYTRAYGLTWIIAQLFALFGESLFIARLVGVIASTLVAILLFSLGTRVHYLVGLISAYLWLFCPWVIAVSQTVREYALFPLCYLLIIAGLFWCTEKKNWWGVAGIVTLSLFYALVLDPASTFVQIIPMIVTYFIYYLTQRLLAGLTRHWILLLVATILPLMIVLWQVPWYISTSPELNSFWIRQFFSEAIWSYPIATFLIFVFFLCGSLRVLWDLLYRRLHIVSYCLVTFLFFLGFFTFHFDRYLRPRYSFVMLLFYLPVVAYGMYALIAEVQHLAKKVPATLLLAAVGLMVFSPAPGYGAATMSEHGYVPITDEYHDSYNAIHELYGQNFYNSTVLCSHCYLLLWNRDAPLRNNTLYVYSYTNPERINRATKLIRESSTGWAILDWRRHRHWASGLPLYDFIEGNKSVQLVDSTNGFDIFYWEPI